ncbi:MAG: hypothetical protein ACRCXT_16750 [Paraclostridium sp.]
MKGDTYKCFSCGKFLTIDKFSLKGLLYNIPDNRCDNCYLRLCPTPPPKKIIMLSLGNMVHAPSLKDLEKLKNKRKDQNE